MSTSPPVYSAILGTLYGQAIGDAMGMPSELWPLHQVRDYFGWIEDFVAGPAENVAATGFCAGQFTDDTWQAIALIKALIDCDGQIKPTVIARYILQWAEQADAFNKNILGPTSKQALLAIREGTAIELLNANGVTNGAAMRIAPLGCLLSATMHSDDFIQAVRLACSPTHKSDIALAGAVAIAFAVSLAVDGADWQQIKQQLPLITEQAQQQQITTFSPSLSRRINQALALAGQLKGASDKLALSELYYTIGAGMDTIESIPVALAMVELANTEPQRCAVLSANLGGDTDTIGAMATAICGALQGAESFPGTWCEQVSKVNQIDFSCYARQLVRLRTQGGK